MNQEDIRQGAAAQLAACRDFLAELIAIKSLSGGEGQVVARIAREMEDLGCYDEVKVDPFGNVMGRLGDGPRVIAFDAHVDTVDEDWTEGESRFTGFSVRG